MAQRAEIRLGEGAHAASATLHRPAWPKNLGATAGKHKVSLLWNALSGLIGYKVYYSQGGKYILRAFVTKPGYADTGLTPNSE